MTIQWCETGKSYAGTLKIINFTYATPYENLYATPISVPNVSTLPGTPIDSYTVKTSDFPTVTPNVGIHYTGMLVFGGKNTDTTAKTVNFQINKNGTSVIATTFSSTNGQFYTQNVYKFLDIVAGDKLDLYLYCSSSALINYDYLAFYIVPTQILIPYLNVKDLNYTIGNPVVLTQGAPYAGGTSNWYIAPLTGQASTTVQIPSSSVFDLICLKNYGLGRVFWGDQSQSNTLYQHATYRPEYGKYNLPTQVTYREVLR